MRRRRLLSGIMLIVLVLTIGLSGSVAARSDVFYAGLSGRHEVPPNDSRGFGFSVLKLNRGGDALHYLLVAGNIDGVTQAHIHCGGPDVNGPVVAFLFGPVPEGVTTNGIVSHGSITNAEIIPRPDSEVCPGGVANFDDLIAKMRAGETYVNVHSLEFPPGEIRGQVR